jgi:hypothetical protein
MIWLFPICAFHPNSSAATRKAKYPIKSVFFKSSVWHIRTISNKKPAVHAGFCISLDDVG